jgi:NTE family protein
MVDPQSKNKYPMTLSLIGSGYRATLFHLGALTRLNDFGLLPRFATISSTSGGSIVAGLLAARWDLLHFDDDGVAADFQKHMERDILELTAANRIGNSQIIKALRRASSLIGDRRYRTLTEKMTFAQLPEKPDFIFLATNLETGKIWSFSRNYIGDSSGCNIDRLRPKDLFLATVMAAAGAVPKCRALVESKHYENYSEELSEASIELRSGSLSATSVRDSENCLFVSDAGVFCRSPRQVGHRGWEVHPYAEVRAKGAYWNIAADITQYPVEGVLDCPPATRAALVNVSVDFTGVDRSRQQDLIDWGFASCDAAVRASFDEFRTNKPDASPHGTFYAKPGVIAGAEFASAKPGAPPAAAGAVSAA